MGTEIAGKPHTSPLVGDEKVPLSPDGFATTQEIADLGGGGSGLPPQWSEGGNGDVTATVDDPTKTPFTIEPPAGSYAEGSLPYFRVAGEAGAGPDTFFVDTYGSLTITGTNESLPNQPRYLSCDSWANGPERFFEILEHQVLVKARGDSSTDPFAVMDGNEVDMLRISKPDTGECVVVSSTLPTDVPLTIKPFEGQTAPLQEWKDENGDTVASVGPHGETVIQPTDVDAIALVLQALAGQDVTAPQLLMRDELGHEMWSLAQEPDAAGLTHHVGLRDSSDSEWNALFYIQLDNHEAGSQYQEAAFALGTFHNGNAILFDAFWNEAVAADNYTNLAIRRFDDQTVPIVTISEQVGNDRLFVVGKAGAIGTSAGEPADGDINAGECFRWFDVTNGASKVMFKGKSANGTVVRGSTALT